MSRSQKADELLIQTFAKLDAIAFGISTGIVCGLGLFIATVALLLKGGYEVGRNLGLLAQYFPGYSVTWTGSLIGGAYALATGFAAGFILAFIRNLSLTIYAYTVRFRANLTGNRFLDRFDS